MHDVAVTRYKFAVEPAGDGAVVDKEFRVDIGAVAFKQGQFDLAALGKGGILAGEEGYLQGTVVGQHDIALAQRDSIAFGIGAEDARALFQNDDLAVDNGGLGSERAGRQPGNAKDDEQHGQRHGARHGQRLSRAQGGQPGAQRLKPPRPVWGRSDAFPRYRPPQR